MSLEVFCVIICFILQFLQRHLTIPSAEQIPENLFGTQTRSLEDLLTIMKMLAFFKFLIFQSMAEILFCDFIVIFFQD